MTPKMFTAEARAAIESKTGPLFDAIVDAYIAENIEDIDDLDERDPYEDDEANDPRGPFGHVPALLNNFVNPFIVHLVYAFYEANLPTHVSVSGQRVRVLEAEEAVKDRASSFRSFNLVFGGEKGWFQHATTYAGLGHNRQKLERLAIRWLDGDWQNDFFDECKRVPGFDRQLDAVTVSEDGQLPSDDDILHLAGYKQLKDQYARQGGKPEDMDELMRAALRGDDARYRQLLNRLSAKQRKGCMSVVFFVALVLVLARLLG